MVVNNCVIHNNESIYENKSSFHIFCFLSKVIFLYIYIMEFLIFLTWKTT